MAEMNLKTAKPSGDKSTYTDDDPTSQLHALRAEVEALAETMGAFVKEQAHVLRVSAGAAADDATAKARKMREGLTHEVEQAEKALDHRVQEHPLQSILMAFGLGVLVSMLLRR